MMEASLPRQAAGPRLRRRLGMIGLPVLFGLAGASGGTSAAAMVACCAHRVADLLLFLGLTAAASFLAAWKVPLMIVGLAFSVTGITLIGWRIVSYRKKHRHEEAL